MIKRMLQIKTRKGQAAITDALFFLLVIVTLSVLMFRYSSTYGSRIDQATSDLYYKEYTNSVLKTIFYVSAPLDYNLNLEESKENDYLMAMVKQDFYAHGKIGFSDVNKLSTSNSSNVIDYRDLAKYHLYHTVKATMAPLTAHDYLFYLYNTDNDSFAYFMIKNTDFNLEQIPSLPRNASARGIVVYGIAGEINYLCNPNSYSDVRAVVSKSPKIFSSSIPLSFVHNETGSEDQTVKLTDHTIVATFALWPATVDINSSVLENLSCEIVNLS